MSRLGLKLPFVFMLLLGVNCSLFETLVSIREEVAKDKYVVILMNSDQNNRCNTVSDTLLERINQAYTGSPNVITIKNELD